MKKNLLAAFCFAAWAAPVAMAQTPPMQPAPMPQTPPAAGVNCYTARLRNASGMFLTLNNGQRFQVVPGSGRATVTTWLPQDRLQVCRVAGSKFGMTNMSRPRQTTIQAVRQATPTAT
jgi:hypothetical protein